MFSPPPYPHELSGKRYWVEIDKNDDLYGLHRAYLSDPLLFKPEMNKRTGRFETWGINHLKAGEGENKDDLPRYLKREAKFGHLYKDKETPQTQFITHLIMKKMKELKEARISHQRNRCDYMLEITMPKIKDGLGKRYITRSIKVSGGLKLNVFQDRILQAVMGWSRNYHGYLFTDHKDGSLFGPRDSNHVDMVNMYKHGHEYIADDLFTIGDILENEKSTLGYLYDLGDDWAHHISVEAIFEETDSDGTFVFLDGKGACPAEDMGGGDWKHTLEALERNPEDRFLNRQVGGALNYRDTEDTKNPDWIFDPYRFDIDEATLRVRDSISSRTSMPSGAKINVLLPATTRGHFRGTGDCRGNYPRKTRPIYAEHTLHGYVGYIMEVIRDGPEPRHSAICEECGRPNSLKRCKKCNGAWYCSAKCQNRRWPYHKIQCRRVDELQVSSLLKALALGPDSGASASVLSSSMISASPTTAATVTSLGSLGSMASLGSMGSMASMGSISMGSIDSLASNSTNE